MVMFLSPTAGDLISLTGFKIRGKYNDILTDLANIGDCTIISGWTFIDKGTKIGENCRFGNDVQIGKDCAIGNGVNIQPRTVVTDDSIIGNNVFIGAGVMFIDEKYPTSIHNLKTRHPIIIDDDAIIGTGAHLVCCRVYKGGVVGAKSLVLQDVSYNEVVAGTPAKLIYFRDEFDRKREAYDRSLS